MANTNFFLKKEVKTVCQVWLRQTIIWLFDTGVVRERVDAVNVWVCERLSIIHVPVNSPDSSSSLRISDPKLQ